MFQLLDAGIIDQNKMERITPKDLTGKICNLLNNTLYCATADLIKKFAEGEFIIEQEVGSLNSKIYGKIQLPTQVSVISYFFEPYLFMQSEFEKSEKHKKDYLLEVKIKSMADIPIGDSTSLTIKQTCEPKRIFSRFPLYGRLPEQYEQMIENHLERFLRLYLIFRKSDDSAEFVKNIKNAFVEYKK